MIGVRVRVSVRVNNGYKHFYSSVFTWTKQSYFYSRSSYYQLWLGLELGLELGIVTITLS
jgi:predicted enzyme related to lactoylglutathione lyase